MSNFTAQIHGRLARDPQHLQTKSGVAMTTVSVAVNTATKADEDHTTWCKVLAFSKQAEILLAHTKGDPIAVSGRCRVSEWTGNDGAKRQTLELVADVIHSARTVLPDTQPQPTQQPDQSTVWPAAPPGQDPPRHPGPRHGGPPPPEAGDPGAGSDFDDAIPF